MRVVGIDRIAGLRNVRVHLGGITPRLTSVAGPDQGFVKARARLVLLLVVIVVVVTQSHPQDHGAVRALEEAVVVVEAEVVGILGIGGESGVVDLGGVPAELGAAPFSGYGDEQIPASDTLVHEPHPAVPADADPVEDLFRKRVAQPHIDSRPALPQVGAAKEHWHGLGTNQDGPVRVTFHAQHRSFEVQAGVSRGDGRPGLDLDACAAID